MASARVCLLLILVASFGACIGGAPAPASDVAAAATFPRGVHPYPDGTEWPPGLSGPFPLKGVTSQKIASFDGVVLDGWIVLPDVPAGVKVPVVLWSAPYFGQCAYVPPPPACNYALGSDPQLWDNDRVSESVPVNVLRERGYAVAIFNVRGTGNSGGCFEWFGPKEQRDQAVLVDWLAKQPWSNGRVGMMGLSYHGTTPWEAAIQNPPALKTIVVAGMVGDAYTFSHTPQGAVFTTIGYFDVHFALRVSLSPPINGPTDHWTAAHAPVVPQRLCQALAETLAEEFTGTATDIRNGRYWNERRLIDQFPNVTTSVLLTHGFQDNWGSGHQAQENAVWHTLVKSPKRQLEGQWGHEFPNFNSFNAKFAMDDWNERLVAWLDFWLKGIGDAPPREGLVDYQDGTGAWHESNAWPPAEARDEVLFFTRVGGLERLSPTASGGVLTFRASPNAGGPLGAVCPSIGGGDPPGAEGLLFATDKLAEPAFIAGNPIAYLGITSDRPGGLVAVHLYDVQGEPGCSGLSGRARRLGAGVADLRFHAGNFRGADFPLNRPTPVRIDITDFAEVIPAGHRLVAVLSYGNPTDRTGQPFFPALSLQTDRGESSSHLVIPLVNGTFGGGPPTLAYPPRPFVPRVG